MEEPFVQFLAGPDWGATWARPTAPNGFLSANARFDLDAYRSGLDPQRDEVRVTLGTDVLTALADGVFRLDASDPHAGTDRCVHGGRR